MSGFDDYLASSKAGGQPNGGAAVAQNFDQYLGQQQGQLPVQSQALGRAVANPGVPAAQPQSNQARPFFEMPNSKADLLGPLESGLHIASGVAGQVVGGLAGIGSTVSNLIHGQSLPDSVANAGNTVSSVQNAMTYEPRTALGHDITNVVQYPFQKLNDAAQYAGGKVTDWTGSPALGTAVNTGINMLPMMLGGKGSFESPVAADFAGSLPDPVANARGLGLKLTPTQAQGSILSRVGESLASHAKLERDISRQNATAVDAAAAREVGINGPVTADSLNAAKAPHNAVYDELSSLGSIPTDDLYRQALGGITNPGAASFPDATPSAIDSLRASHDVPSFDAGDAVQRVRTLRNSASQNIKAPYDPERQALGYAQKNVANALESQIERHLQNASDPNNIDPNNSNPLDPSLISRFQNARQSLAKIHSVEDALKAGKGQAVSALNLAKQNAKGVPLSGNLKTIAQSAENFPRAFQDLDKIRNSGPLSMPTTLGGGMLAVAHPAAWPAALTAILGPPALRGMMTSDFYQHAAFDPRVPQTYARPGLVRLGAKAVISGQGQRSALQQLLDGQSVPGQ